MDASIVFIAGICDDSGHALTYHYNVYTRESKFRGKDYIFWNEPEYASDLDEAKAMCEKNNWEIVSVR